MATVRVPREIEFSGVTMEERAPGSFTYDPRVQRPEDPPKLRKMINEWDPVGTGILTSSRRENASYVILDGRHRDLAAQAVGWAGPFDVKVFHGLSLPDEAYLFKILNNTTKTAKMALFNVAVTEGDSLALAVKGVLDHFGLVAHSSSFSAISVALRICARKRGVEAFSWAIDVAHRAYGVHPRNLDGRFISALADLRLRDQNLIDTGAMVRKLAGVPSGVPGVIGKARTIREVRGGSLATNAIDAIVGIYNKNQKQFFLEEWRRNTSEES